jgi:hypothetical protein
MVIRYDNLHVTEVMSNLVHDKDNTRLSLP